MILTTGQRGRLRMQTVSHSPVGFAIEYGLLDESEAMHHEERHLNQAERVLERLRESEPATT